MTRTDGNPEPGTPNPERNAAPRTPNPEPEMDPVLGAHPAKRRHRTPRPRLRGASHGAAELLERQMAVVLPQEIEEPLVIVGRHVEQLHEAAVAAACVLEPAADDFLQVGPGQIARHERAIDRRPERFAALD